MRIEERMMKMAELVAKIDFDEDKFLEMIENFKKENPDFVEVVRCKDCVAWDACFCILFKKPVWKKDYCSKGVRRNDE